MRITSQYHTTTLTTQFLEGTLANTNTQAQHVRIQPFLKERDECCEILAASLIELGEIRPTHVIRCAVCCFATLRHMGAVRLQSFSAPSKYAFYMYAVLARFVYIERQVCRILRLMRSLVRVHRTLNADRKQACGSIVEFLGMPWKRDCDFCLNLKMH